MFLCPHDRAGVSKRHRNIGTTTVVCFYALMIGLGLASRPQGLRAGTAGRFLCPHDRAGVSKAPKWWVKLDEEAFLCPHDRAGVSKPYSKVWYGTRAMFLCPHDRAGVSKKAIQQYVLAVSEFLCPHDRAGVSKGSKTGVSYCPLDLFLCPHDRAGVSKLKHMLLRLFWGSFYALMIGLGLASTALRSMRMAHIAFLCPHDRAGVSKEGLHR